MDRKGDTVADTEVPAAVSEIARCLGFGRRATLGTLFRDMRDFAAASTIRRIAHTLIALLALSSAFAQLANAQTASPATPPAQKTSSLEKASPASPGCQYSTEKREPTLATLEAETQHRTGNITYADGCVEILYENFRLRADHVEYDDTTKQATAHGHVVIDHLAQHVEADEATYNLQTERGTFHHVRATMQMQRRPIPTLLITPNPIYF